MDMLKVGSFLAELRNEHGLTQAELGEKLGVTNKTISRWETGTYMPPVEMLEQLSIMYNMTINELLSGEKLSTEEYKVMAEVNIKDTLKESGIVLKIRRVCKTFWKRFYIFIPLIFGVFFALGYLSQFNRIYYGNYSELYGTITDEMSRKMSFESGLTWAFLYSSIVLLVVFVLTMLTASKSQNLNDKQMDSVKKLKIVRRVFITPFIISILICLVGSITGVGVSMMGSSWLENGLEALTTVAMVLVFYIWWLYIICLIGIIVTSVMISKLNKG